MWVRLGTWWRGWVARHVVAPEPESVRCQWDGHPLTQSKRRYHMGIHGVERIDQWHECPCGLRHSRMTATRIARPYPPAPGAR